MINIEIISNVKGSTCPWCGLYVPKGDEVVLIRDMPLIVGRTQCLAIHARCFDTMVEKLGRYTRQEGDQVPGD